MAFINNLTTILDDGTWGAVTKPYLCETPLFNKDLVMILRRAILVALQNEIMSELDIGRAFEGAASVENYNIKIVSVSRSEVKDIAEKIRTIIILYGQDNSTTRAYHSLDLGGFKVVPELGKWVGLSTVKAWVSGAER